jgi:CRISPR-associated protein Cas1
MLGKIVDVYSNNRSIKLHRGFLQVLQEDVKVGEIAIDDVFSLILSAPQLVISKQIINELSSRGIIIIICNEKYQPSAYIQPISHYYKVGEVIKNQINATLPIKKKLWQKIVEEKIKNQALILNYFYPNHPNYLKLLNIANSVKSGDSSNAEGLAARIYWQSLMGENFKRDQESIDVNIAFNYAYIVLRSAAARSICASGLIPGLGLFHKDIRNPFTLADDIMEPYRPLADFLIFKHIKPNLVDGEIFELTPIIKQQLVKIINIDLINLKKETTIVNEALNAVCLDLNKSFENLKATINYPKIDVKTLNQL